MLFRSESNDQLRQRFVNQTIAQGEILGLTFPDKNLKWNETKKGYDFSEPDWTEFNNVIHGNGPCNKERLGARIKAHEEGKWVREAAMAHAEKKQKLAAA